MDPSSSSTIENVAALVPFYEQLYRLDQGFATEPLHIIQYGDSHTASDDWANTLREQFQSRFGIGGAGYSLAGRPYNGYRRFDLKSNSSPNWYSDGLALRTGDGRYGRGGVSMTTHSAGEWVSLVADCQTVEVFYLQQPGGGRVQFTDNGSVIEEISTNGDLGPGYRQYKVEPGQHRFELRTLDNAPVRLFGWMTEQAKGIAYETLGVNGAQASIILNWDPTILASNLARHQPALILLAYGTNDASNTDLSPEGYRATLRNVVQRIRDAAPQASIVLIGPPDRYYRILGRGWTEYPRMQLVVDAERDVAKSMGCAFWDLRGRMGGGGVMPQYVQAGLVQADHVHFTREGYQLLGRVLYQELMSQYAAFVSLRQQMVGKDQNERPAEDSSHR